MNKKRLSKSEFFLIIILAITLFFNLNFASAEENKYLEFYGNTSSYTDAGNSAIFNFSNDFSVTVWINGNNLSSSRRRDIVTKGKSGDYEWALAINSQKKASFIIFNNASNNYLTATGSTILKEGKWYHIAGGFNGTSNFVYVNGNLEGTGKIITGVKAFTGQAKIIIGSRETIGGDTPFSGYIDDVLIYNKLLDRKQIRRIYNGSIYGSNLGFSIPVLSYHKIDDDSYTSIYIVNISNFQEQMNYLNREGYETITYDNYLQWRDNNFTLPEKPIIIVFDDGTNSIFTNATPIMERYGYVGVLGAITNRTRHFSGYMDWNKIETLKNKGWQIASHSVSHRDMRTLSQENRIIEFNKSKQDIINNLNMSPSLWIYPFNGNNALIDVECSNFYTICSGYGSGTNTMENFLFKKANLTYEIGSPIGLRRITVANDTTLEQFKSAIDYHEGRVAYWKFDEQDGNLAYDSSGYGNNAELVNVRRI